jgi:hypothetical protein
MKALIASISLFCALATGSLCTAQQLESPPGPGSATSPGKKGTYVYNGEYRFTPPPPPWELLRGSETTDYVVAFYRKDPGSTLNGTVFAYDEEPYGHSRDIEERTAQFLKRFFWSSYVRANVLEKRKATVLGNEGLVLLLEGRDPVKKYKVRSKIFFGRRGERIVAFWCNQWRTFDRDYDLSAFDVFDRFVGSFGFERRSFYENL